MKRSQLPEHLRDEPKWLLLLLLVLTAPLFAAWHVLCVAAKEAGACALAIWLEMRDVWNLEDD